MVEQANPYVLRLSSEKAAFPKTGQSTLSELDIELTERCNNNCIHCCINLPADDAVAHKRELTTAAIKEILKEAASLGCLSIRFTGGEPLLRDDFEELYLYARRLGLKVLLFTNATLISPSLAELLAAIPPLEKIEVTLYGMKKVSYEAATRTPGSFDAARRGIHLLLERQVPFIVKSALLPHNRDEVEEFETWASTIPWMEDPPTYSVFFDLHCRRDQNKNEIIRKVRPTPREGLQFLARKKTAYLKELRAFCSRFVGPTGDKLFSCGAGVGGACVDSYGNLQPCMGLRHPDTVYDLKKGSIEKAMKEFFPLVRKRKAAHPDYLARCARCLLKGLCEQCPGKSWMEHGTLDTPIEYLCEIAHAQGRSLGLLGEKEQAWEIRDWEKRIRDFSEEREHELRNAC
jgi:MoaA/NifB/PqqE/SkfB family radical SAM enzyme